MLPSALRQDDSSRDRRRISHTGKKSILRTIGTFETYHHRLPLSHCLSAYRGRVSLYPERAAPLLELCSQIASFVLFYTAHVVCEGRLTMAEIIFSLKHSWWFVDLEALE
jgi:hypothetical protein